MGNFKLVCGALVMGVLGACSGVGDPSEASDAITAATESLTPGSAVLLVVGNTTLSATDAALAAHLQGLGGAVTVRSATASVSADATGKALVVISETVSSADVNTKFRDSPVPVLCLEPALFDDFGMTGPANGTDYGTTLGQTDIELLGPPALLTGGTIPISTNAATFAWGKPGANATKIARVVGSTDHIAIFGYDAGQPLVTGIAAARRVGWPATGNVALTTHGWKLFDAAVKWLAPTVDTSINAELANALQNLNGFTYKNGCKFSQNGTTPDASNCSTGDICWATADLGRFAENKSIAIGGPPGRVYEVDLNVLGVLEPRDYPAAPNCTLLNPGATTASVAQCSDGRANINNVTFNVFELGVPGTSSKFYLNDVLTHPPHRVDRVDALFTITVNAGSTLQFAFDDLNGGEIRNCTTVAGNSTFSRTPSSPFGATRIAAPAGITEPFNGQWFQLSVVAARLKN